jgi:NAD(P)H-dependent flavin oxidoreductase YrpB (nitropropane dioxygenase family)
VVERVQGAGLMIGALAGSVKHALNHKAAGLDFIICQGSEGGGHTGDVGSIVLWPEVIDAVPPSRCWPPAGWAAAARWPPPWPWGPRACGRAPCG